MCIYSYMFKFPSLSKYFPFDTIHISKCFFHCSEQFLNSLVLMSFGASAIFHFTSSWPAKCFPLRTFFIQGNKKSCSGQDWERREDEAQGSCLFWSKTAEHAAWCGQGTCKSPVMKWANALKESSKRIRWSPTQPLTTMPASKVIHMGS